MGTSFRQSIHDLLAALPNQRLDALKKLFWSELNYVRANEPLSTRTWADGTAESLADPPLLFATAGEGFHVIYCRLNGSLNLTTERQVVGKLLAEHPYGLFIFSDASQTRWHFVNVKYTSGKTAGTRRLFRRITVTPYELLRTAAERIALLDAELAPHDLFGVYPAAIQALHDEAFDVEKVTSKFFEKYGEIFDVAETSLPCDWSSEQKRLYTQKFFNRLMFLAFLERKGWMSFGGRRDYLKALFDDYNHNDPKNRTETNFHRIRLNALFFKGLSNSREQDIRSETENKSLVGLIGDVPYLNGGLFDKEADDEICFFSDKVVADILNDLVYAFNFTVTESTPLDVEVAVDPEMLGKIFEKLVTGRHESGSYYTIKPVVAFMCYEALAGYLQSRLPNESGAAILQFVYQRDPSGLRDPEGVLEALRAVKVCDPACGSGAYLLGMLHVLLELRECLFVTRSLDPKTVYERKLEIIQNSLYGVDIDPFAVNIARLRLWLSLIVDFEGETPPPLPNLNYKIETGDSLTAPDPSSGLEVEFRRQLVDEFLQNKKKFLTAHHAEKISLQETIEKQRAEIKTWSGRSAEFNGFDWTVEFAEIFMTGDHPTGFDIILANPPYVRADTQFKHISDEKERQKEIATWQAYRAQLKASNIYKTLHEKWDLYVLFLERACQLLQPEGQMVFIIPDAYNAAKYAEKSHEYFLQNSRVKRIDFCSEINLFDAGVNNTILHFEKGVSPTTHQPIRARRWGKRDEFDDNFEILFTTSQAEFGTALFKPDGVKKTDNSERFVKLDNICYISYGLRANSDERFWRGEFVTDDLVSDIQDVIHSKPFVEGKDLIRWWIKRVHYLEWGTERAPHKFARPTFPELHEASPKLISLVVVPGSPPVVYDEKRHYTTHTSCIFVPWYQLEGVVNKSINKTAKYRHQNPLGDREQREETSHQFVLKYVLAIMNSTFASKWLKDRLRSKNHVYPDDWKQLPIAPLSLEAQQPFVEKVDAVLGEYALHGYPLPPESAQKVKEIERELDEMVGKLYA